MGVITKPTSNSDLLINNNLLPGQSNQKQPKKPDNAAKRIEKAYKSIEQSYLRQIALVDQLLVKQKTLRKLKSYVLIYHQAVWLE